MSAPALDLLRSIIAASSTIGDTPVPPTGINSSAGTSFSFSNAALDNTALTTLTLTGGVPQGTGTWSIAGGSWAKVRLSAVTGLSTELRIDDDDGLDATDNGAKSVTVEYDGEGLGSPLSIALTITITTISVPTTGGHLFLYKPKWLPQNDNDFVFVNVPAGGEMNLPEGDESSRNKVLVVVPPVTGVTTSRIADTVFKWGAVIMAGFDHQRQGYTQWAGPNGNTAPRWGGHIFNLQWAAGSSGPMNGKRPFLWVSNHRFRRHATNGSWAGDFIRCGTAQVNDGANRADYHDTFMENCFWDEGHLCWDASSGSSTNPHSDLIQHARGGGNIVCIARCHFVWNGLSIYLLDSGNIENAPNKTKSPQGARFFFEKCSMVPQEDPFDIDNGAWRYYTQARQLKSNQSKQPIWTPEDGLYRAMFVKDVGFHLPVGHPRRNNLPGVFATPYYPEPAKVDIAGGDAWLRWVNPPTYAGRLNGDHMVEWDRQARFYDDLGDMPIHITAAETGGNWRFTNVQQIRAALTRNANDLLP